MNRTNSVFISRIALVQNPRAAERLRTINKNIEWDPKTEGCYIIKNSTAHGLALLLGFTPYDNQPIADGTYDRTGLIK